MKKTIIETVKLGPIVPGGQTIGELSDSRKVFVWGGLPNETVRVQLTKLKKSYAEGIVMEVIEASDSRTEPRDECYLSTSPWQIMTPELEVKSKSDLVVESFAQTGVDLSWAEIKGDGKFYNYRNKMEYSLWWDHDTDRIWPAFHKRGSHQKILVNSSSIERPEIWAECQRVINQLNINHDEARRYQSLLIRCNQAGEVSGALFEMNKPRPVMQNLTDKILGRSYSYSPNGFFQINLPVYEMALSDMSRFITTDRVVDMYSGVGTIGLSIADNRELTLVETDNSAYGELENNLRLQNSTATGVHAKSEEALEYITDNTTIIIDPPRAGLDKKVIDRLIETKPPVIIYLSCNPATQARDVAMLMNEYIIAHNQPYNFFPRTPHIENLVVLKKI